MPGDFGLVYPLWNYSRAPENLLDRVVGEVGLDHLTVPVVTGAQSQFRLAAGFESPHFHTEGGWHFPPQSKLYAATGIRPRTAKWFGTRDVLAEVREYAAKLRLDLILRIDLPRVSALVDHAPQIRCRSAWGDELLGFGPCVCNPDFRELLRTTLTDLARYEPAGFEIENLRLEPTPLSTEQPRLWQAVPEARLAQTCFCPACRQVSTMAGLDADAAAGEVQTAAEKVGARAPRRSQPPEAPEEETRVRAHNERRRDDLRAWLARLAAGLAGRRLMLVSDDADLTHEGARAGAANPAYITMARVDPTRSLSEASLFDSLRRARCGGFCLPVWGFAGPAADDLVRLVSQAANAGIEFVEFEHVEEAPREVVTWIKQAVRFARRG